MLNQITLNGGQYPYKAYLNNLLTYGFESKMSHLEAMGWNEDTKGKMEPEDGNFGFEARYTWFRKGFDLSGDFRPEGFTMIGRLQHERTFCKKIFSANQ